MTAMRKVIFIKNDSYAQSNSLYAQAKGKTID